MVFSVKANKKKIIAVVVIIALAIFGVLLLPKVTEEPEEFKGETNSERIEFISSFNWVVSEEPVDSREVTIPATFSEVYTAYNAMQMSQGFDLKPYAGQICTQYVYVIENYPNETREVHLTLLVYGGQIIGGDVSCAEVDGFMHGFAIDSARYGQADENTQDNGVESQTASQAETENTQDVAGEVVTDYPTD